MRNIKQNPDTQHEYNEKLPDVLIFHEAEEILVEPGDVLISVDAPFDAILFILSEQTRLIGEYMSQKEIWDEMRLYVP